MAPILTEEDYKQIPLPYRVLLKLLLKVPSPSFPFFVVKRLTWIEGVFWALVAPMLLFIYFFFSVWFLVFLSLNVVFPWSIIIWLLLPGLFFVLFVRIVVERAVIFWKNLRNTNKEWNVSKSIRELAELMEKQRQKH